MRCPPHAPLKILTRSNSTQGDNSFAPPGNPTRISAAGARYHNHYATDHYNVLNFAVNLISLPQSRSGPTHIPFPSPYIRHFCLSHHTPIFSGINLHDTSHKDLLWSNSHPDPIHSLPTQSLTRELLTDLATITRSCIHLGLKLASKNLPNQ